MADKTKNPELEKERSLEEIQREILEVQLQTQKLQLAEAKDRNAKFLQAEEVRRKGNKQRQAELAAGRAAHEAVVKKCRHKSGGSPKNILRGGGIGSFSIITRALMPDGVTWFLQCPRCGMKRYYRPLTPPEEAKLQKGDAAKHALYVEGKRLFDISNDQGIEHAETRGPTFFFQNAEGIPIVPEMV